MSPHRDLLTDLKWPRQFTDPYITILGPWYCLKFSYCCLSSHTKISTSWEQDQYHVCSLQYLQVPRMVTDPLKALSYCEWINTVLWCRNFLENESWGNGVSKCFVKINSLLVRKDHRSASGRPAYFINLLVFLHLFRCQCLYLLKNQSLMLIEYLLLTRPCAGRFG